MHCRTVPPDFCSPNRVYICAGQGLDLRILVPIEGIDRRVRASVVLGQRLAAGRRTEGLVVRRIQRLHKGDRAADHPGVRLREDPQLRIVNRVLRQALDYGGVGR